MSFVIEGLGTALPGRPVPQRRFAEIAEPCCAATQAQRRLLPALYRRTRVLTRHSVLEHAANEPGAGLAAFYTPRSDARASDHVPSITQRMHAYEQHAPVLAARAASAALADANTDPGAIDQLVTVSCTGFAAPGTDVALIDTLGLKPTVGRTHVGFMGCHGAMNGLRAAHALSRFHDTASVLMVCVELCSLHFAYGWEPQRIVANALFGDGAAAIVGRAGDDARHDDAPHHVAHAPPRVVDHAAVLLPEGRDDMSWYVRDHGFEMSLSPTVPQTIGRRLSPWMLPWLAGHGLTPADVGGWAIHPGGPRVISATQEALGLDPAAGDTARGVLADVGNVSSGTVLFILERLRAAQVPRPWVTLAFGPGLTIEAALIR